MVSPCALSIHGCVFCGRFLSVMEETYSKENQDAAFSFIVAFRFRHLVFFPIFDRNRAIFGAGRKKSCFFNGWFSHSKNRGVIFSSFLL
jgi:hypothetical protein